MVRFDLALIKRKGPFLTYSHIANSLTSHIHDHSSQHCQAKVRTWRGRGATQIDSAAQIALKDAILEPDIYDAVMLPYLQQGGKPVDAVGLLAESYAGVPSMINAAADCASQMGLDPQTILLDTIKRELITHFDPRRVDEALAGKEVCLDPETFCRIN